MTKISYPYTQLLFIRRKYGVETGGVSSAESNIAQNVNERRKTLSDSLSVGYAFFLRPLCATSPRVYAYIYTQYIRMIYLRLHKYNVKFTLGA